MNRFARIDSQKKKKKLFSFRKILVSVKFVSPILGPEMAARNFMGAWKKCVLSAGKPMSIKFLVLGGGGILGLGGGGGSADFIFTGAGIFLIHNVRAVRANRLKTAIRNFLAPRSAMRERGFSSEPCETTSRESGDSRESANRSRESGHLSLKARPLILKDSFRSVASKVLEIASLPPLRPFRTTRTTLFFGTL